MSYRKIFIITILPLLASLIGGSFLNKLINTPYCPDLVISLVLGFYIGNFEQESVAMAFLGGFFDYLLGMSFPAIQPLINVCIVIVAFLIGRLLQKNRVGQFVSLLVAVFVMLFFKAMVFGGISELLPVKVALTTVLGYVLALLIGFFNFGFNSSKYKVRNIR